MISKNSKKIIKRGFQCLYAAIILIDSIYRKDKNYFPKVLLLKVLFYLIHRNFL